MRRISTVPDVIQLLVVDDNPIDRMTYRGLLAQSQGTYSLLEAELGEEGLAMFADHQPDCVLLDFNLPDLNGLEFLKALQESDVTAPQPVLMLTGEGSESVAVEAMKRGAQDYLLKGQINVKTLHRAIHNTIEKIQLHRQVEKQQAELKDFTHAAAHDLKSPLTRISNYSQLLQRRFADQLDERGQKYLDGILSGTQQMNEMIEALLTYARIGHSKLHTSSIPLRHLLEQTRKQLQTSFAEEGLTLEVESPDACIVGDELQLTRVFQNILSNALKFRRDEPPHIVISVEESETSSVISIKDNGTGIPEDACTDIFVPFHRLPTSKHLPGHGIGLATCKKIIEEHGGSITVTSQVGQGSTFLVTLPRCTPHGEQ